MSRALDVVVGVIAGGIVWFILDLILSPIPILGWIIAAVVAGYVAGRLGGGLAGVILAILSPVASYLLASFFLSFLSSTVSSMVPGIGWLVSGVSSLIEAGLGVYALVTAGINLLFVGAGAAMGAKSYNKGKKVSEAGKRTPVGSAAHNAASAAVSRAAVASSAAAVPTAPTATSPVGAQAATPAQPSPLPQRLVESYIRVKSDPRIRDKSFRNVAYVNTILGIASRTEEYVRGLLKSLPDQQQTMFAAILRDSLEDEFRKRAPNLDPPDLSDPLGRSLIESVKYALMKGLAEGKLNPIGAKSQEDVERLVELTASELVMDSLIKFLTYVGVVRLT